MPTEKKTTVCPACESKVTADRIDESALSPEARIAMTRDERRSKFRTTRQAVDALRAEKVARRAGREIA